MIYEHWQRKNARKKETVVDGELGGDSQGIIPTLCFLPDEKGAERGSQGSGCQ
jgi:hypothetical protein